jgi:hypothetical protein
MSAFKMLSLLSAPSITLAAPTINKPLSAKVKKTVGVEGSAAYENLREYVAMEFALERLVKGELAARAFATIQDAIDEPKFVAVREAFASLYDADYKKSYPDNDEKACTNARYQAWTRFLVGAESLGYINPLRAKKEAKAKAEGKTLPPRSSAKPRNPKTPTATTGAKAGNATGKGANQVAKSETVSQALIAVAKEVSTLGDTDMSAALQWVNQSATNKSAFIAWYKAQAASTLTGNKTAIVGTVPKAA